MQTVLKIIINNESGWKTFIYKHNCILKIVTQYNVFEIENRLYINISCNCNYQEFMQQYNISYCNVLDMKCDLFKIIKRDNLTYLTLRILRGPQKPVRHN